MLYKKRLITWYVERVRYKHKPLDCVNCDLFQGWCRDCEDQLVAVYNYNYHLSLAPRQVLCILLKRSLFYKENVIKEVPNS